MVKLHPIHRYQSPMLKNVKGKRIEPDGQQYLKNRGRKEIEGVVNHINEKRENTHQNNQR